MDISFCCDAAVNDLQTAQVRGVLGHTMAIIAPPTNMLSNLLVRWSSRTAARRFARRLPQQARRDYGASAFYTKQQIEKSVARAGQPSAYIVFGYAMLLDKQAFDRDCSQMTRLTMKIFMPF